MLFNSLAFLLFFPIVTIVYFLLPHKYRWAWLLAASCFFYMFFKPIYILILFFTIIIDYYAGIWIENAEGPKRKQFLAYSLIANIGVLAIFKYFNFINGNIDGLASLIGFKNPIPYLSILLPVGLSFHTFQAMSYTIEVYRGNQKAEKHFGIYSLYVMYYPQLVAGPIERPQNILYQFHKEHYFDYNRTMDGLRQIMWGFYKKVVVADRLAIYANEVFNNVHSYKGFPLIWASIFFSFQIYCDFSGYSDIALGCSKIMGIDLMRNFNLPYISQSIKEFWSRWHISLSTWFRDYLYISLGGNRKGKVRWYTNIFIVFMISGLWHGANWTFIVWGIIHGVFNVFGIMTENIQKSFYNFIKIPDLIVRFINWILTLLIIILSWIFFRANNIDDAIYVLSNLHKLDFSSIFGVPIFSMYSNLLCVLFIIITFILEYLIYKDVFKNLNVSSNRKNIIYILILFFSIYLFGVFEKQSFIYFQF